MPRSCPDCGSAIELSEQEAVLLTGTCSSCGKAVTVVSGVRLAAGAAAEATPGEPGEAPTAASEGPECPECGGPLAVELEGRTVTLTCDSCDTNLEFVKRGPSDATEERTPGRSYDRPSRDRGRERPSNARPCRQCGAPLRFTTDENGVLTGECDSCGNRFTLPPRREGPRDRGFSGPPRGGRSPREFRERGGGSRYEGGPRRPKGGGGRYRSYDRDGDEERPRRRPRRE